jgi:DNA-binding transcriptional MerR regulator
MATLLTIGEFSRLTHLSVKALRHYDDVGLLRPADVDAATGYRRYAAAQVPVAHVIRRFRDLDMPLGQIRAVLEAPDIDARDRAIVAHLERMERVLEQTRETVASLRRLLDGGEPDLAVEYRSVPVTPALAIGGRVAWGDAEAWLADALGELGRAVGPDPGHRAGPDGALYGPEFFEQHVGEVVAFVPLAATADAPGSGRAERVDIPAADLAVTVHRGPFADVDQAYGALGTYVAERMLGADGPIREHYLDGDPDPATEVCWPVLDGRKTIPPDSRDAR